MGEYVHWGATTQDIMDTGMILQLREVWAEFAGSLSDIKANLRRLAETHKSTPMPGRTHGQQALPITFGYKVAVWIAEAQRHQERMEQAAPRIFNGQFSGAVGTLASLGDRGLEVQPLMMQELGLTQPLISWHSGRDGLYEFTNLAAMLGGLGGQIAREVFTLSRTEIAELEEPFHHGKVGSSTMPQKRNPAICEGIMSLTRSIRSSLSMAFDALSAEHERDKVATQTDREYLPRLCCQVDAALKKTAFLTAGLTVNVDAMRRNLDITKGLLLSEAVMMQLAEHIGRQEAHDVVYEAAMAAHASGRGLKDHLLEDPVVADRFSSTEIDALLDPAAYVGLSEIFVERVLDATA
jgi:adenylosuccinate lyase